MNSYKENGIEGLKSGKAPGASYKLIPQQREELVQVIVNQLPADVGFSAKFNWTLAIIAAYIEREWNVNYTQRGVSKLLHALGLSYTRPTYVLAKADPAKQKAFMEKTFPELKKLLNQEIDYLLFQDETMIRDYQAIQCTRFLERATKAYPHLRKTSGRQTDWRTEL